MPRRSVSKVSAASLTDDLFQAAGQFQDDPLGFVLWAFPWGEDGTPLFDEQGPDKWQGAVLKRIGDLIRKGKSPTEAAQAGIRLAVASGHGIGKTTLVAWIILWFIATRYAPQIIVTANTKAQLANKTWRELAKWHKLSAVKEWFVWTATKFYLRDRDEDWFATAQPWSKERSEAFAGTHEKHVLIIFDEASAIPDEIWEVAEGAMTTDGAMWLAFGNPTRNTGRFRECFRRFRHRWNRLQVDSRSAKMANKAQIDAWIEDYGADSDFVRIRVLGQFPRASSTQFIGQDIIDAALKREIAGWEQFPRLISVDVARFGDDQSVILRRQGPRLWAPKKYRNLDTVQLAYRVIEEINEFEADAVFVDAAGMGAGVVDTLNAQNYPVYEVLGAERATDEQTYYNKRAEMWGEMREWLKKFGSLKLEGAQDFDQEMIDDLTGIEYGFDNKNRIQLEKKEDMKSRGLPSPDSADALSGSFYIPVAMREPDAEIRKRVLAKASQDAAGTSWMAR